MASRSEIAATSTTSSPASPPGSTTNWEQECRWPTTSTDHASIPSEVEHIWADKFERHAEEFPTVYEFEEHRNSFGDLLLLPKDFNASYGAMPYEQKVQHYSGQNILAKSLHPLAYQHHPSFNRLRETYNLAFEPYPTTFTKDDIETRQALYRELAEVVWSPERIGLGPC